MSPPALPLGDSTLDALKEALWAAADAVLAVYAGGQPKITYKDDQSPVTEADYASHRILAEALSRLTPDIPVLSEESEPMDWATRRQWDRFWLVDPLDGTKEFLKANDQFTINVALIEGHRPSLGFVVVPTEKTLYLGVPAQHRCELYHREAPQPQPLKGRLFPSKTPAVVLASHNHSSERYQKCLNYLKTHLPTGITVRPGGSALKFCWMAQGQADFYPRLHPTSLWDTAAPHALLTATGGAIFNLQGEPLRYNHQEALLNPDFIAVTDASFDWQPIRSGLVSAL